MRVANIDRAFRGVKRVAWIAGVAACATTSRPAPIDPAAAWTGWVPELSAPAALPRVPRDTPVIAWEANAGAGVRAGPVVTDQVLVLATTDRRIRTISRQDGSEYWSRRLGSPPGPPLAIGDRIYVGTEGADEGEVRALRFEDGGTEWRRKVGPVRSPIAHFDGTIYGATEFGLAFALQARDGRELWKTRLPGRARALGPVVSGQRLLVISGADTLYSLDRTTGQLLGRAPLPAPATALPALAGDTVVVPAARGILAAYTANGPNPLWESGGFDAFVGPPVLANGEAWAVTRFGQLIAFRLSDGRHRVIADLREGTGAGLTLVQGGFLVGTFRGRLHLLDWEGRLIWTKMLEGQITHAAVAVDGGIAVPMFGPVAGFLGTRPLRGKVVMLR